METISHLNVQNLRDGQELEPVAQGGKSLQPVLTTSRRPRGWEGSLLPGSWLGGSRRAWGLQLDLALLSSIFSSVEA